MNEAANINAKPFPKSKRFQNLTGKIFQRWTVVEYTGMGLWKCKCECGNDGIVKSHTLTHGYSGSCGCLGRDNRIAANTKHSAALRKYWAPTYITWRNMKARCTRSTHPDWHLYGGRGIRVCSRWLESFGNFLADMGERPHKMSIDRFPDNNGNYEPSNCRWATNKEQCNNQRTNKLVTYQGKTQSVAMWAGETGMRSQMILDRIRLGWPIDAVFSTPKLKWHRITS